VRARSWESWNLYRSNPFKLFVLDQDCQKLLDRAYAADSFYLPSEWILPSSIQGFALCRREDKSPVIGFYCFPFIHKRGWRKERILRITRPLPFSRTEEPPEDAFVCFIKEIMELDRRTAAHQIEIELYREIRSKIFFPSTNCAVHTYNSPTWVDLFEKAGFACSQKTLCFEIDLHRVQEGRDGEILVRPYRSDGDRDRKLYYDLWTRSGECPYDLADSGFWYANAFGWPRLWYSEAALILSREEYILFAERDGKAVGMIHWWPNVYPLLREGGRKAIFLPEDPAKQALNQIKEGKIFKIAVSDRAGRYRDRIVRSLIGGSLEMMKEKFQFQTCQIGNVPSENEALIDHLHRMGAKKVHELWLMRKKSY
jgi:hypothetical protein